MTSTSADPRDNSQYSCSAPLSRASRVALSIGCRVNPNQACSRQSISESWTRRLATPGPAFARSLHVGHDLEGIIHSESPRNRRGQPPFGFTVEQFPRYPGWSPVSDPVRGKAQADSRVRARCSVYGRVSGCTGRGEATGSRECCAHGACGAKIVIVIVIVPRYLESSTSTPQCVHPPDFDQKGGGH